MAEDIRELIEKARTSGEDITESLRQKSIDVPAWSDLEKAYDPKKHPVMDESLYPDITIYQEVPSTSQFDDTGEPVMIKTAIGTQKVSRITYDLQRLAVKRTTELCFGVPVKRKYYPSDDKQELVAKYLENIFQRNRIDSVNIDRGTKLFASCEVMTLWYSVKQDKKYTGYGFESDYKLRCVTYSPMQGDELYPLFDEYGDLVALSISYRRKVEKDWVEYFDTWTSDTHLRYSNNGGSGASGMTLEITEDIEIGKIPGIYMYRPTAVYEDANNFVYEMEWAVSRNGNYLRENSRPILAAFVGEEILFGKSPVGDGASKDIVQYPPGSDLRYVTWAQAIDNLKFYVGELRQAFFTTLQLPDWSYENMKTTPMSGEARKQLFIDCHLKVKDESGRIIEFLDREVNVVKAHLKVMLGQEWEEAIDSLQVENIITPYTIHEEKDDVELLLLKNGNKPLMSQRESIQSLGESEDVDKTMEEMRQEDMIDALSLAE